MVWGPGDRRSHRVDLAASTRGYTVTAACAGGRGTVVRWAVFRAGVRQRTFFAGGTVPCGLPALTDAAAVTTTDPLPIELVLTPDAAVRSVAVAVRRGL